MKDPTIKLLLAYILVALLMIGCSMLFSGCRVFKDKQQKAVDSLAVDQVKRDAIDTGRSGIVTHNTVKETAFQDWWKKTVEYAPGKNDTLTNITRIIYEGGNNATQKEETRTDSSWIINGFRSLLDSLHSVRVEMNETSKKKESSPVMNYIFLWFLIGYILIRDVAPKALSLAGYEVKKKVK